MEFLSFLVFWLSFKNSFTTMVTFHILGNGLLNSYSLLGFSDFNLIPFDQWHVFCVAVVFVSVIIWIELLLKLYAFVKIMLRFFW